MVCKELGGYFARNYFVSMTLSPPYLTKEPLLNMATSLPRQRGSNENTNRLLRQYLPKKADLSSYPQSELDKIALRLNQRPQETLGFETPASRPRASVLSTG
jgi:hypothetical protein